MSTYISISEMAKLHGITRQTLIHYDSIDLFKPAKGRIPMATGIIAMHLLPYLREILFFKVPGDQFERYPAAFSRADTTK